MLQIEEWFRRPQSKTDKRERPQRPVSTGDKPEEKRVAAPADAAVHKAPQAVSLAPEEAISLSESMAETEEIEQINERIGLDVADLIDLEKEDFLLKQIDEFREKARQLQQMMATRQSAAEKLENDLGEKEAQASELDDLIELRQNEADKIMGSVSERINAMSEDVRQEMSGLSDAVSREVSGLSDAMNREVSGLSDVMNREVSGLSDAMSREVSGLSQNLTHEIGLSTESTRQAVVSAAQNVIDQNTRSLEGLKEQLEQLEQLEQINELSTEMSSQITTLKSDIAEKIHAEDVKCYRNIQASMNEQSKMLSDADEKTRQHIQEQMDNLQERMASQGKLLAATFVFSVLSFLGAAGILAWLMFI